MINILSLHALKERLAATLDSIKINTISEQRQGERCRIIKHRTGLGRPIAILANLYFAASGIPIRYQSKLRRWRVWEINCFRMLNHDRYDAAAFGASRICIDKLPGQSLWTYLTAGRMTRRMVRAAGRELRRAHGFWSEYLGGRWSHGDASMSNFIYDEMTGRARLIDFEIVHDKSLPAEVRQADDLHVFLLDLVGFVSARRWLPLAPRIAPLS